MLSDMRKSTVVRGLSVAAALAAAALLSACGYGGQPPPQIASLHSSGASTTTSTAAVSGRPQWRLDSTNAEVLQLWENYYFCLRDHGHKTITTPKGWVAPDDTSHTPADKAAVVACANKMPLEPDELDRAKNPHYVDEYHVYMKCLTDHGMAVHAIDPYATGWTHDDGITQKLSPDQEIKVDQDCKIQAFSNH